VPLAVGEVDVRKRLADGGDEPAGAVLPQACGQVVISGLERREELPRLLHIKVEPLIERRLESIRPMKGLRDGRLDRSDLAHCALSYFHG